MYRRQIRPLLQRLVQTCKGDHQPRCLDSTRRPNVPCEPYPISIFILLNKLLVRRHIVDLQTKHWEKHYTSETTSFSRMYHNVRTRNACGDKELNTYAKLHCLITNSFRNLFNYSIFSNFKQTGEPG